MGYERWVTAVLPTIDESEYPIIRVVHPAESTLAEVEEHARRLNDLVTRLGPVNSVANINALRVAGATARHRRRMSEIVDDLAARGALISEAIVAERPALRGLVTAYTWLRAKKDHPFACFASDEDALAWTRRHLR